MDKIKDKLINGEKDHKSFKDLFKDAFKFTFKKPIILLFLGLFLLVSDVMVSIKVFDGLTDFILIILILILAIYELGYAYLIFEKSIEGVSTLPSLFNIKKSYIMVLKIL